MASGQYRKFMAENRESQNVQARQMVETVGRRIQVAVTRYMEQQGLSSRLRGFDWEFRLIESKQVNAWCMPGGKVAVYTGILPVTKDDAGLAVVIGHEIAHAVAGHGGERMSQGMIAQFGSVALSTALKNRPQQVQQLFGKAYGLGTQVGVLLPFSRRHEYEADHLGLIFMAMAGYDPRAAPAFWKRMSSGKKGAPPEFLSTHPADRTRIQNLQRLIPEAMPYYRQSAG